MLGLKSGAVATLCSSPGFPPALVINARVYRYKKSEVEGFLKRLEAGEVPAEPRARNKAPVAAPARKVAWSVDVTTKAPKRLTSV